MVMIMIVFAGAGDGGSMSMSVSMSIHLLLLLNVYHGRGVFAARHCSLSLFLFSVSFLTRGGGVRGSSLSPHIPLGLALSPF